MVVAKVEHFSVTFVEIGAALKEPGNRNNFRPCQEYNQPKTDVSTGSLGFQAAGLGLGGHLGLTLILAQSSGNINWLVDFHVVSFRSSWIHWRRGFGYWCCWNRISIGISTRIFIGCCFIIGFLPLGFRISTVINGRINSQAISFLTITQRIAATSCQRGTTPDESVADGQLGTNQGFWGAQDIWNHTLSHDHPSKGKHTTLDAIFGSGINNLPIVIIASVGPSFELSTFVTLKWLDWNSQLRYDGTCQDEEMACSLHFHLEKKTTRWEVLVVERLPDLNWWLKSEASSDGKERQVAWPNFSTLRPLKFGAMFAICSNELQGGGLSPLWAWFIHYTVIWYHLAHMDLLLKADLIPGCY